MTHSCCEDFDHFLRFSFTLNFTAHCTLEKIILVPPVCPLRLKSSQALLACTPAAVRAYACYIVIRAIMTLPLDLSPNSELRSILPHVIATSFVILV